MSGGATLTDALALHERGFSLITMPLGTKIPKESGWQDLRLDADGLRQRFNGKPLNLGALCGAPSRNHVDVDIDAVEALRVADLLLPATGLEHGRPGAPRSHRWYEVDPAPRTVKWRDPTQAETAERAMLVELRSSGVQTVVPPSVHTSGESYAWDANREPARVDGAVLAERCAKLAAVALLARHWRRGARQDIGLALCGGLLRAGWPAERVGRLLDLVMLAADDEERERRGRMVQDTAEALQAGALATGWPRLRELLDPRIVKAITTWLDVSESPPAAAPAVEPVIARLPAETPWPDPLAPEALYGLAGHVVAAISPHSEADQAALLGHFLTGFGALVNSRVHGVAGDAPHPARLNAVCVGETSRGRKGSSARPIERLLHLVDAAFAPARIADGLSSGEGLIWAVRNSIEKYERVGTGRDKTTEMVVTDPGIDDKRLWVVESEFGSVLRMIQREGSSLSAIVRRAWDSGELRTLTKNTPAVASGAHISIMGHVTKDELLRYVDRTELASGFCNRFLWLAVRRAQLLPDGDAVPELALLALAEQLRAVVSWAATPRVLTRDDEARALWHAVYGPLTEGRPGLFGAATSRAEAQVLRLSVLYAILECSETIRAAHLQAALAVWQYAEASARWIFGDAVGDPTADTLLAALRQNGMLTRDDIFNLFGRHLDRGRIARALGALLSAGLARMEKVSTGGRPAEVWYPC